MALKPELERSQGTEAPQVPPGQPEASRTPLWRTGQGAGPGSGNSLAAVVRRGSRLSLGSTQGRGRWPLLLLLLLVATLALLPILIQMSK